MQGSVFAGNNIFLNDNRLGAPSKVTRSYPLKTSDDLHYQIEGNHNGLFSKVRSSIGVLVKSIAHAAGSVVHHRSDDDYNHSSIPVHISQRMEEDSMSSRNDPEPFYNVNLTSLSRVLSGTGAKTPERSEANTSGMNQREVNMTFGPPQRTISAGFNYRTENQQRDSMGSACR